MSSHSNPLFTAAFLAAVFFVITPSVLAQVQVVESPAIRGPGQQAQANAPAASSDQLVEMFYQMQQLQQQVQVLTGMVEEANYELKRLKQQQLDDYVDLDRRLSELAQGGVNNGSGASSTVVAGNSRVPGDNPNSATRNSDAPGQNNTAPDNSADEFASYNEATKFVRERQWQQAVAAYQNHIQSYPGGRYVPNSHYWLGEVYLVQNELALARNEFNRVVTDHPQHDKAIDAKFKLGQVYFRMGEKEQARRYLQEVAATDTNVARLAQNFLRDNFPN